MPIGNTAHGPGGPSCWGSLKMGFMMGFTVGMGAGVIFGTVGGLRMGHRGRELMGSIGRTMFQSGGTFGTFMAIGMGMRSCI